MTIREQAITGIKWTAGGKLAAQVITWGITLIVMRLLHPEDYGLLAMASVFLAFMLMISEAGLAPALVQKQELSETILKQVFAIIIVINLALLVIMNLLAPSIAAFFNEERLILILNVMSLQFLTVIAITIPQVLLYRELKFKYLSIIEFIAVIAGSLFTLILAILDYGVWALIYGNLLTAACKVIAFNVLTPVYLLPKFSLTGMRSFLSFGGNITLARILSFFFHQIDVIIVGKMLGKEMLGYYSVSMHLASLPVQRVSGIINQVSFPVFSKIQNDHKKFQNFVLKIIRVLSIIAFPVLWGVSSVADELVRLFLGEKWLTASLPLQLLCLIMPFRMTANFLPSAIDALGRPDIGMRNMLLAAIVMPIAFLIGSIYGIIGVALAWIVVYPVVLLINIHRLLNIIKLRLLDYFHAIAPVVGITAGMYLVIYLINFTFTEEINLWMSLLLKVTIGVMTYIGLTLFFNKQSYREAINLIWNKK